MPVPAAATQMATATYPLQRWSTRRHMRQTRFRWMVRYQMLHAMVRSPLRSWVTTIPFCSDSIVFG